MTDTIECSTCEHIWAAQWPRGCRELECPVCHQMTAIKPDTGLAARLMGVFIASCKEAGYACPAALNEDIRAVWPKLH